MARIKRSKDELTRWGQEIKALREDLGLTQPDVNERAGYALARGTVGLAERGKGSEASLTKIQRVLMDEQRRRLEVREREAMTVAMTELLGPLARMRMHTARAHEDAAVLHVASDGVDTVSLSDVYVERHIEQRLLAEILGDRADAILIEGEAGTGKTSLLWRLSGCLRDDTKLEPWLLRSDFVRVLDLELLVEAIAAARAHERRPVLLLDTVDMLLHTNSDLAQLCDVIETALAAKCKVVYSCRPLEARSIPKSLRRNPRVLGDYDDDELARAIQAYVKRYYARAEIRDAEEHHRRLTSLIAEHHAMHEVCSKPLTLQMLFVIYAPGEVQGMVDAVRLYDEYWTRRVEKDWRPGQLLPDPDAADLSPAVGVLAVRMLVGGEITISRDEARTVLDRIGKPREWVDVMVSRGHLRRLGDRLEFFHQTLLENAAARALLGAGPRGIEALYECCREHPEDLLVAAVLEHALIIASRHESVVAASAVRILDTLLTSPHVTQMTTAIAVYTRSRSPSESTFASARVALANSDVAERFIHLAPSIPSPRMDELFVLLSEIWVRCVAEPDDWNKCLLILDKLVHFAMRDTDHARQVRSLLTRHQIVTSILAHPRFADGSEHLLTVIAALAPVDEGCWRDFVMLAHSARGRSDRSSRSARSEQALLSFMTKLLAAVARAAPHLGHPSIADDLRAELSSFVDARREVTRAWGAVWAEQWRSQQLSFSQVLARVCATEEQNIFRQRLNGIVILLEHGARQDAEAVWARFTREPQLDRQHDWSTIVFRELFDRAPDRITTELLGQRIAQMVANDDGKSPPKPREFLITMLRGRELPGAVAGPLLRSPTAGRSDSWLSDASLGNLLVGAIRLAHQPAEHAAELMDDHRRALIETSLKSVLEFEKYHRLESQLAVFAARWASICENTELLCRLLESADPDSSQALAKLGERIHALAERKLDGGLDGRGHGARLQTALIRCGLGPSLAVPEVQRLSARIREYLEELHEIGPVDPNAPGHAPGVRKAAALRGALLDALKLLGEAGPGSAAGLAEVELLHALGHAAADAGIRHFALDSYVHVIRTQGKVADSALAIARAAFCPPMNSAMVEIAGRLINDLVPNHMEVACSLLVGVFGGFANKEFGAAALGEIGGSLHNSARRYFSFATNEQRDAVLGLVRTAPRRLSKMLIEAGCPRTAADDVPEIFAALLLDSEVPDSVKSIIQQRAKTRILGPAGRCPELAKIVGV